MAKKPESKTERRLNFVLIMGFQIVGLVLAGLVAIGMVIGITDLGSACGMLIAAVLLLSLANIQITLQFWRHYRKHELEDEAHGGQMPPTASPTADPTEAPSSDLITFTNAGHHAD
ncbi:MAG: hypothetical protein LBL67_06270 [Coriobacteriales bacterium]|nr:hypothetical protein [Coriobacteriales bacterium]